MYNIKLEQSVYKALKIFRHVSYNKISRYALISLISESAEVVTHVFILLQFPVTWNFHFRHVSSGGDEAVRRGRG